MEILYAEDMISALLTKQLDDRIYFVLSQTPIEHQSLLYHNLFNAIIEILFASRATAIIPLNIEARHWVGLILHREENRQVRVVYIDSGEENERTQGNVSTIVDIINQTLQQLNLEQPTPLVNIIAAEQHPSPSVECGPAHYTFNCDIRGVY